MGAASTIGIIGAGAALLVEGDGLPAGEAAVPALPPKAVIREASAAVIGMSSSACAAAS